MKKMAAILVQQIDLVILVAVGLLIISGYLFAEIADEVIEGEAQRYDETILEWLRNPADPLDPIGPPWLEQIARDITALGSAAVLLLVTAAVSVYLLIIRRRKMLIFFLAVVIGGGLLVYLGKALIGRPRPEFMSILTRETSASFPSGHAMLSTVVYLTIGVLLARTTAQIRLKVYYIAVALAVTLLVGFSRIYLGVHYPTDVLGGFSGGFVWALVCWIIAYWLQKRGAIEQQNL